MSSGPSTRGPNLNDSTKAMDTGMAMMKMIAEAPSSPAPTRKRGNSMKFAPRKAAKAPTAVATEFIVTTCSRGTTCGSAAESPDATNRDKPLATSAANSSSTSPARTARIVPIVAMRIRRAALAPTSTSRRSQRSISAPANGPSSEYGRNSTVNARAMAIGSAARSGLNSSAPASPA